MNAVMGTGRFRHIAVLLASACMLMIGIGAASVVHAAEPVTYIDPADPTAEKTVTEYTVLTNKTAELETGWYVVSESVTFTERIIIKGKVDLLLCDDAVLKAPKGIQVTDGNALTVWAQGQGDGVIEAKAEGSRFTAPIGGGEVSGDKMSHPDAGAITINGGRINATCDEDDSYAAAIGGGYALVMDETRPTDYYNMGGDAGEITINGGRVTAVNNAYHGGAPAIGSAKGRWTEGVEGETGGKVTITEGTVSATGAIGIGSDSLSPDTEIKISGGEIEAISTSSYSSDAISGTLDITGGRVTAIGGSGEDSFPINEHRTDQTKLGEVRVLAGADEDSASLQPSAGRVESLKSSKWARIEACDHSRLESRASQDAGISVRCYCGLEEMIQEPEISIDTSGAEASEEEIPVYYYDGEEHLPAVTVTSGDNTLVEDRDYVISCYDQTHGVVAEAPVKAGEYQMIVSGRGLFTGLINEEKIFFIRVNTSKQGTITFWKNQNNDDKEYRSIEVSEGESIKDSIPEFTFEGHEFTGWYTDRGCTAEFKTNAPVSMKDWETQDLYLYAGWKHTLEPVEEKAATCDTDGTKACYSCKANGCKALFLDEAGTQPVSEEELVIPKGHSWGDPSYTWDGGSVTAMRMCGGCSETITETTEVTEVVTRQPSCTETGRKLYIAPFIKEGFETQTRDEDIPASHAWNHGKVIKQATTTAEGQIQYECNRCGETKVEAIPMLEKKAQSMTAKGKTVKVKAKKLKKKKQTIAKKKAITVKNTKGTVTYTKVKVNKKKYAKKFIVNKKTGKITVKKGVKKGKYKLTVKVTAAGNAEYKAASKNVTVVIKIK